MAKKKPMIDKVSLEELKDKELSSLDEVERMTADADRDVILEEELDPDDYPPDDFEPPEAE
jgi:hypothetical protein